MFVRPTRRTRRTPRPAKLAASLIACAVTALTAPAGAEVAVLPDTVVTAARIAQTADETFAPVSVVTREDIERLQAHSVQDVLRGLPGIAVSNQGGRGKLTSLFLRGGESDHVLVLVDGIKVGSATAGQFSFEHVPIDLVERIEVVRGPRASLYGSEAIGGVIQIFTRKGGGALAPYGRISVGSGGALDSTAGVSGGGERGWFNLSGSFAREDGINACDGYGHPHFFGCFVSEPDRDGFRNRGASARAGYRFENGVEIEGRVLRSRSDVAFDGPSFVGNESDARQSVYAGTLRAAPRAGWRTTLRLGRSHDEVESFHDGAFVSKFVTRRDDVTLQNDIDVGETHRLSVGLDHRRDHVSGAPADYTVRKRDNTGGFAQLLAVLGEHEVQLAGRHDDNRQFGRANTGSIAWGWQLRDALRFVASYGTAFKAPTFNELYWPGYGNEDLDPEESATLDLGLSARRGPAWWSINAFRSEVENLIAHDSATNSPGNVSRVRIHGLEAALGAQVSGFDLSASLTLLDPRNRDAAARGKQLVRRPRQVVRVDVDRTLGRFDVGATVHAEGSRYDDLANTRRIGGFYTADLRAAYRPGGAWSVQGRVENLFDRRYETVSAFNQPGRGFFITLRYRP